MQKVGGVPVPVNITPVMMATIDRSASIVQKNIQAITPVRTGFMRSACRIIGGFTAATTAKRTVGWRSSDFTSRVDKRGRPLPFYPVYVSEGTGRFRARDAIRIDLPIGRPKKGANKYIRYQYNGGWVSLKAVKGQKPQHIIERAIEASRPEVMALLSGSLLNVQFNKVGGY